jgi:hypothetical protein
MRLIILFLLLSACDRIEEATTTVDEGQDYEPSQIMDIHAEKVPRGALISLCGGHLDATACVFTDRDPIVIFWSDQPEPFPGTSGSGKRHLAHEFDHLAFGPKHE